MASHVPASERLRRDLLSGRAVVAGVLSGTSADGIDVALARFRPRHATPVELGDLGRPVCLAFATVPFPNHVADRLRRSLDGEPIGLGALAVLDRDLGRSFGYAARDLAQEHGLEVQLIGSHGQTLWHHDGVEPSGPATLQIGDGDHVAEAAGCAVACDFRQRDVAAGGQGAPLTALTDPVLFPHAPRPCAILNLGGMANLTLMGRGGELVGFDTGPAGALLDGLARRRLGRAFDAGGEVAAQGCVDEGLLSERLEHPFFASAPPKSTGRDTFGEAWVAEWVERGAHLSDADLLATAVALVAETVRRGLASVPGAAFSAGPKGLYLAGGGVHNARLVAEIAARTALPAATTGELGIDPDAREALSFSCLAAARVLQLPVARAGVTGATGPRAGRVLGKLCAATP